MVIFPLSWPGKIVLILIAVMLGLIFWMLGWPEKWRWLFDRLRERNRAKAKAKEAQAPQETASLPSVLSSSVQIGPIGFKKEKERLKKGGRG